MSTNKSTDSTKSPSQQQYYPSQDVCDRYNISGSTLRKWCIALEGQGYEFTRTEQNRRLFTDVDINVLAHLKELIREQRMSLENASIIVASKFVERSHKGTPSVPDADTSVNDKIVNHLQEHIQKQEKFNKELLDRLDKQNRYINDRIDQRDKVLLETLKEMREQRKEEIKLLEQANENKGNWLTRLFKK